MAGRIRSIKPEILEDEKTAGLSHLEWRLFVSLWLIADDYGNLRGEPDYVRGQTVWASKETRESVAAAIQGLVSVGLLTSYIVRGQCYLHVSGWEKHQRVDKRGRPRMPGPEQAEQVVTTDSRDPRETLANSQEFPANPRNSLESLAPDLRSPISDPEGEALSRTRDHACDGPGTERAPQPKPAPVVASTPLPGAQPDADERRAACRHVWDLLVRERAAVVADLGLSVPAMRSFGTGAQDAGERDLAALYRSQTRNQEDRGSLTARLTHRIRIAALEARRDRTVEWLSPRLFADSAANTRRDGMTEQQAAAPRAPPKATAEPDWRTARDQIRPTKFLG